ncbi:alpha/beta hydrolase [Gordonia sp. (in: high G+C Gram-positive bacteria)]|uniref:alpha/beta hydrolase n=1 Tax=unclassified Gordonia (in: high G+C Gram-positive bacteria) TaxID=2657482 RepID=UPI00261FCB01|nr:alpha/beta hydrolase [Gordonia sp. (in: high G+C Gram-positive bacteria)]
MTTYRQQPQWRAIQEFLPADYRLTPDSEPAEEWWEHRGHRIHLDTYRNPDAPVKVILLHGVGTNGRQMSTILGHPLATRGYETIAIDMPTYGITAVAPNTLVTYDDWVRIGSDLVDAELAKDDRPVVLYGLSAGGMETYHVAALNRKVAGIVGMTFLDTASARVVRDTAFDPVSGLVGKPLMHRLARTRLRDLRVPMRYVSKMRALVNNRAAKKACYADTTSAGNSVTVGFLDSWLQYRPAVAPEDFDVCPVLLTQPDADRWTPLALSTPFLDRITAVPVTVTHLENGGHYPLEQPALDQMVAAVSSFLGSVAP